jgi:subtilisin-like proprotein convertase family protein
MTDRFVGLAVAVVFCLALLAPSAPAATFSNSAPIALAEGSAATPYPSTVSVSGVTGTVVRVRATLTQLSEKYPNDIDILLVGPGGAETLLMSDTCGSGATPISGQTFVFDDAAPSFLPTIPGNQCVGGTYQATDFTDGVGDDHFPLPAPAGPYVATLSVFNGVDPNGTWQLWVRDDDGEIDGSGSIAGGWSLDISTPAPLAAKKKKKCKKKHGKHKTAIAKKKKCKKHHK